MEKIVWNRVTWYSKWLALFFFVFIFPVWCFYIGMRYGEAKAFLSMPEPIMVSIPIRIKATSTPAIIGTTTPSVLKEVNILLSDNGKTIHLKNGQRVLLKLGTEHNWTVSVTNMDVLLRFKSAILASGAQGLYITNKVGQTMIVGSGLPICMASSTGVCKTETLPFAVTLSVDPL